LNVRSFWHWLTGQPEFANCPCHRCNGEVRPTADERNRRLVLLAGRRRRALLVSDAWSGLARARRGRLRGSIYSTRNRPQGASYPAIVIHRQQLFVLGCALSWLHAMPSIRSTIKGQLGRDGSAPIRPSISIGFVVEKSSPFAPNPCRDHNKSPHNRL
jgi:hypothetical protein